MFNDNKSLQSDQTHPPSPNKTKTVEKGLYLKVMTECPFFEFFEDWNSISANVIIIVLLQLYNSIIVQEVLFTLPHFRKYSESILHLFS